MDEFTGNYNICTNCGHIYDYNDSCTECGGCEIEDLNALQVKKLANACSIKEMSRLHEMLQLHGD